MNKQPLLNWVLTTFFLVIGLLWLVPWASDHQLPQTRIVTPQPTSTKVSPPEPPLVLSNDVALAWTGDDQYVFLWREAGMSNYIDRKLVLRQGNIVKYGLITNIESSITPVSSSITVFTVDCNQRTVNVGLSRSYSHEFGSGDLLIVSDIRKMGNSFDPWFPEMRHPQILCALTQ